MSNRGPLAWNSVLRDLKADRSVRSDIREQRNLRGGFSAWRGLSGTRYITSQKARELLPVGAVVLAVSRDAAGVGSLVAVAAFEGDAAEFAAFRARVHGAGATELQIHTLAETPAARAAMVADLAPGARMKVEAAETASLAPNGVYSRSAIMGAAVAMAKGRQAATGAAWGVCMQDALKAAWAAARAARAAAQQ